MITSEGRYFFAIALIRQSSRDLDPASRRSDLGLRVLRALIYDSYIELVEKITVDKHIDPEDYYYLGFHFAEEGEQMGRFGIRMLRHLVEAFPRHKISEQAQQKLRLHLGDEVEEEEPAKTEKAKKPAGKKATGKKKAARKPARKKKAAKKKKNIMMMTK